MEYRIWMGMGTRVPSLLITSVMAESSCGDEWVAGYWNTQAVLIIVGYQWSVPRIRNWSSRLQ